MRSYAKNDKHNIINFTLIAIGVVTCSYSLICNNRSKKGEMDIGKGGKR